MAQSLLYSHALVPDRLLSQSRIDTWGAKDGLPLGQIDALAQTPDGYIWVGTPKGLFRFDGASFDRFDMQNTLSLTGDHVTALSISPAGDLWVGIERGGFGIFKNGVFSRIDPPTATWNFTYTFTFAADGSVWVGMIGDTSLYHVQNGVARNITSASDRVMGIIPDSSGGALLAEGDNGLEYVDATGRIARDPRQKLLPSNLLRGMLKAEDGSIWIGTDHNGVCRIQGNKVTVYTVRNGLTSNGIVSLSSDNNKRIWICTKNGVNYYDGQQFHGFTRTDGLPSVNAQALTMDREDNLWVAAGSTLARFADTPLTPYTIMSGSAILRVKATAPSTDSGLWCATDHGLRRLHNGSMNTFEARPKWPANIDGLAPGDGHSVWAWTASKGHITLQQIDGIPQRIIKPQISVNQAFGSTREITVPGHWTPRVAAQVDGRFILTTREAWFDVDEAGVLQTHPFPFNFIFDTQLDSRGAVWVTSLAGLIRIQQGKAELICSSEQAGTVVGVDAEKASDVLIATDSKVARVHDGKLRFYDEKAGLPAGHPFQIIRDFLGNIWVGYDNGIYYFKDEDLNRYDRGEIKTLSVVKYQASDGIRAFPIDKREVLRTNDGDIWFAGNRGITRVDPGIKLRNMVAPPVVIQSAIIDRTTLIPGTNTAVRPGDGSLRIRYAALSYVAPEKVQFRTMLEGFDAGWVNAGSNRQVTYNSLSPGRYRFHVAACNDAGVWNDTGASTSFDLKPHYYQTVWFRILIAILSLLALVALYCVWVQGIRRRKLALESQIVARTSEIQAAYNELISLKEELEGHNLVLTETRDELEVQHEHLLTTQAELAVANKRLLEMATTDGLTGLKNHRVFQERMVEEWERAKRTGCPLSLIMLDIDHFKLFNDTFGHPVGDRILQSVARAIHENIRINDIAARYGGEEMIIIAPDTDGKSAVALAERLRAAVAHCGENYDHLTASLGVATVTSEMAKYTDLIREADDALYLSKHRGRNRVTHGQTPQETYA